jgi:hypothetical protein
MTTFQLATIPFAVFGFLAAIILHVGNWLESKGKL